MVRLGGDDLLDAPEHATCGALGASLVAFRFVYLYSHSKCPEIGWVHLSGLFEILNRVVVTMHDHSAATGRGVSFIGFRIETERRL